MSDTDNTKAFPTIPQLAAAIAYVEGEFTGTTITGEMMAEGFAFGDATSDPYDLEMARANIGMFDTDYWGQIRDRADHLRREEGMQPLPSGG